MARNAQGLSQAIGSTTTLIRPRRNRPIKATGMAAEPQVTTDTDIWGRAGPGRSWLRSLIAASPLFLAPMASISTFIALAQYDGSLSLFAVAVKEHGLCDIYGQYGPQTTIKGIAAVICWVGLQAILYHYLPGEKHQGQHTPAGYLLDYKCNGLSAWIVTHLLYATLIWLGILDPGFIPRNWSSLIGAMNWAGFVISALAFVKAYIAPTHPKDRKFSGTLFLFRASWGLFPNAKARVHFIRLLHGHRTESSFGWQLRYETLQQWSSWHDGLDFDVSFT
jgi:7-dehydrocholesterol reductase